jgi:IclR family transcriptional regulator, acetate operon repressor
MSEPTQPAKTMRSLERALDVLGVLERSRKPLRLTDVARESGLHIATAQRILAVLERYAYVAHEPAGYTVGVRPLANAHAYLMTSSVPQVATPVLQELSDATGLTASISVPVDRSRILVARIAGRDPLRYQLPVGQRLPIHVGAGRVVAARLPNDELRALVAEVVPFKLASGERVDETRFRASLKEVRERGYVHSVSERVPGAASVGTPVLGDAGELIAVLQVAGPVASVDSGQIDRYVDELNRAAMAIRERLQ